MQRRISRYRGTIKTKKKTFSFDWEWLIRAIDSNISNCPVSRKSHEIYTRVRCLVINQHDRESSIDWRFQITQARDYPRRDKKFIFFTSKQVLSATRNILNLSGNKGIYTLRVTSRRKDIVQKKFCGKMYVHAFLRDATPSILTSCWCITGHPVGRLYHDVEKVETIGYRCLAHVLLTVPWLRRSLCTCLLPAWPVRYINIFLVLSRYQPSVFYSIITSKHVAYFRCDNPAAWRCFDVPRRLCGFSIRISRKRNTD